MPEIERADPGSPFTPIDVARAQGRLLSHAGRLTTAWLDGAGGIRTRVIHDLALDQAVDGPVRIGTQAAKAAA